MNTNANGNTPAQEFVLYQKSCEKIIKEKLIPRFPNEDPNRILELNTPFDWMPDHTRNSNKLVKTGVIMIHGMYGSSFSMRDLGRHFANHGLRARSLLLPGHCSEPADLTRVNLSEYQKTVKTQIDLFRQEVDEIYIAGFSFGGLLSLDYLNHTPKNKLTHIDMNIDMQMAKIKGLILLSPALGLQSPLAGLLPIIDRIKPLRWYCKRKETDFTRYQSCAVHAGYQVYKLINQLPDITKMALPKLLLSTSVDDEVVCPAATLDFFNAIKSTEKQVIIYGNHKNFKQDNVILRNSRFPKDNMVNASHINLIFSPENSHYGRNGTAENALYRLPPYKNKKTAYGALTKNNLRKFNIYRASYNPEFDYFADSVTKFINTPEEISA